MFHLFSRLIQAQASDLPQSLSQFPQLSYLPSPLFITNTAAPSITTHTADMTITPTPIPLPSSRILPFPMIKYHQSKKIERKCCHARKQGSSRPPDCCQSPVPAVQSLRHSGVQPGISIRLLYETLPSYPPASVGFSNPFQFSAMFKKYFGLSPAAYRKKG